MNNILLPPQDRNLQIEITTYCNLKCSGCFRSASVLTGTWKNEHMPLEMFRKIVEYARPANQISLQGLGEPTLHPNLPTMISIVKESGKFKNILFYSNALVKDAEYYRELHKRGHNTLVVSVDSLNQQISNECRNGGDVKKLFEQLSKLYAIYGKGMGIALVLSKKNLDDCFETFSKIDKIGALPVYVQKIISTSHNIEKYFELSDIDINYFKDKLDIMRTSYKNLNIFPLGELANESPVSQEIHSTNIGIICDKPFLDRYVTINGSLAPCCVPANREEWSDIKLTESMENIITKNPKIRSWLSSFTSKGHANCLNCPFSSPLKYIPKNII